ncbi:hypothetical protein J5N97_001392 [Dioscorea zingiberensis]|uniref:Trichome birefringence-like N-terminal domain-containing protein n=1 Tax=Dioscorea zingiberensis TaxID=325984 RepID=A0A9D5BU62_9LILI|nr:hypothetical protein J5N97_001392 [Dioscorea zingiberensis]
MKTQVSWLPTSLENKTLKVVVFVLTLTLILFPIIPLFLNSSIPSALDDRASVRMANKCDIFRGEWVPNPRAPPYTNKTCRTIHENQNCMKLGRPDTGFLHWRWKPDGCELPFFNPNLFLELLSGNSMAFLGDSVARNQMQSLMCLLSRVTDAVDVSPTPNEDSRWWSYPSHNFTLAILWSPFLVKANVADPVGPTLTGLFNLYLDEPDDNWTSQITKFDYVINGEWNKGGDCVRNIPFRRNETRLDGLNLDLYMTQMEEFRAAEKEANKRGLKFKLLDISEAMQLRPDGHPSHYAHLIDVNISKYSDCVHWCLPGPVDTWNDFLLHTLKVESVRL